MKFLTERTPHYYYSWYSVDDDTYDGPGSPMGFGRTKEEAEQDLLDEIEDRRPSDDGQPSEAQEWSDYDPDC